MISVSTQHDGVLIFWVIASQIVPFVEFVLGLEAVDGPVVGRYDPLKPLTSERTISSF